MKNDKGLAMKVGVAFFICVIGLGDASDASAGSLANTATRAAAKRIARPFIGKPLDVFVRRSQHPQAAAHVEHAQRMGQPTILTLDRTNAHQRRTESLRHIRRKDSSPTGMDRDEYPFAMTREGGFNSNVRYIDRKDNRGAGKSIERQSHPLPDGSRVRVLVVD